MVQKDILLFRKNCQTRRQNTSRAFLKEHCNGVPQWESNLRGLVHACDPHTYNKVVNRQMTCGNIIGCLTEALDVVKFAEKTDSNRKKTSSPKKIGSSPIPKTPSNLLLCNFFCMSLHLPTNPIHFFISSSPLKKILAPLPGSGAGIDVES